MQKIQKIHLFSRLKKSLFTVENNVPLINRHKIKLYDYFIISLMM